jgi:exopolyphosphatase/guanosine-5'-triphosphate,3'-diphosphate pyrophosphatase
MTTIGIDIGTNTILMTVGRFTSGDAIDVLRDEHAIARLGEGVDDTGRISDAAISRATEILQRYRDIIAEHGDCCVRAVATSAVRDAENAAVVLEQLQGALGHKIETLSGHDEALLTFVGTAGRTPDRTMVIDVGGGSTEIVIGSHGHVECAASIDAGSVRFSERYLHERPGTPEHRRAAEQALRTLLSVCPVEQTSSVENAIAVAGTPVALAALSKGLTEFDRVALEGAVLSRQEIASWVDKLDAMTREQLRSLPGVHPQRADVLPAGALILHDTLLWFGLPHVTVSTKGIRYGAMLTAC